MRLIFYACLMTGFIQAGAQTSPQWGNLKPGAYAIGYKTIRLADNTRQYFDGPRPLQIYVWYPAALKAGEKQMNYGTYVDDVAYDMGTDAAKVTMMKTLTVRDFKSGSLNPSYPNGLPDSTYRQILNTKIPVFHEAQAAKGKFPVLLHMHASGVLHQSLMMEYLASHGYVVMSISMYGSSPAFYGRGEDGSNALFNATQDLELVLIEARKLPFADPEKTAMTGMMAQAGLSLHMKEKNLKAIACLDCAWNSNTFKDLPWYNPKKITDITILELINTEFGQQQFSYLDSLPYAERYIGRFNVFAHADFYPFPKIARWAESAGFQNYEYLCDYTLAFLNSVFKDDEKAKSFRTEPAKQDWLPPGFVFVKHKLPVEAPPAEEDFLTWLRYGQMEKVRAAWKSFGKDCSTQPNLFFTTLFLIRDNEPQAFEALKMFVEVYPEDPRNEGLYSRLGYTMLQNKQTDKALEVFELFAKNNPYSPYAINAMADVYMVKGDKTKAKSEAKKLLDLLAKSELPGNEKQLLRENAQRILEAR